MNLNTEFKITKRKLPHWSLKGATYFITFNTKESSLSEQEMKIVLDHIVEGHKKFYTLYAAVVMADHVHLILQPEKPHTLENVMKGIKGASARKINQGRHKTGSIWLEESYDRIIRDEGEFLEKMNYIINNPVKKGLADNPFEYRGLFVLND